MDKEKKFDRIASKQNHKNIPKSKLFTHSIEFVIDGDDKTVDYLKLFEKPKLIKFWQKYHRIEESNRIKKNVTVKKSISFSQSYQEEKKSKEFKNSNWRIGPDRRHPHTNTPIFISVNVGRLVNHLAMIYGHDSIYVDSLIKKKKTGYLWILFVVARLGKNVLDPFLVHIYEIFISVQSEQLCLV